MGVGWGLEARIGGALRGKEIKLEDFCEWRLGRLGRGLGGPAGRSAFMVRSRPGMGLPGVTPFGGGGAVGALDIIGA
jgi:hypothetical protein